jgi:cobalt-precorrin-5B (C1)-methyltransferase
MSDNGTRLRSGFSTGACAAAAAVVAWRCLQGEEVPAELPLILADGKLRSLRIDGVQRHADGTAEARIVKDAGDDVDITHQALIRVRLGRCDGEPMAPGDFREPCGSATLILRGGPGVGKVGRSGLDVPVGKWAINPGPRRMLVDNLWRAGLGDQAGEWLVEISIDQGAELARHTLNPVLGIEGGLSILGTSGLVVPCSNAAYLDTIRVMLRCALSSGTRRCALVTGSRTQEWLRRQLPDLPEAAFIRFGDFIREALELCVETGMREAVVGCMAGKLAKYALGCANTHAHQTDQDMGAVGRLLEAEGFPVIRRAGGGNFATCREFLEACSPAQQERAVALLSRKALAAFRHWVPDLAVTLVVFDPQGRPYSQGREP